MENPFNHYLVRNYEENKPIKDFETIKVYAFGIERIDILIAEINIEKYAIGYYINFTTGETKIALPNLAQGYAKTKQDAVLFVAGYMLQNAQRFSDEAVAALNDTIKRYRQTKLF